MTWIYTVRRINYHPGIGGFDLDKMDMNVDALRTDLFGAIAKI
jgi:hypothetical protein